MTTKSIIWEWGQPRVIQGYFDLGGIQIPPLPRNIVLTDRSTGTQYLLEYNTSQGMVGLNTAIPTLGSYNPSPDTQVYAVGEEPYLDSNNSVRLIVRNGVLGYDYTLPQRNVTAQSQGLLYLRTTLPLPQTVVILTLSSIWKLPGDPLSYSTLTFVT
jgi:hypothetical protein